MTEFTSRDTIQVSIGSWDIKANHDVQQVVEIVQQWEKQNKLFARLRDNLGSNAQSHQSSALYDGKKVLIFFATKRTCDDLNRQLRSHGWPCISIHGDKEQFERDRALNDFKTGKSPIMLATDVASRGIHVDDITLVINYDMPGNIEDYVHRIGRTGRCGKKGVAISLSVSLFIFYFLYLCLYFRMIQLLVLSEALKKKTIIYCFSFFKGK